MYFSFLSLSLQLLRFIYARLNYTYLVHLSVTRSHKILYLPLFFSAASIFFFFFSQVLHRDFVFLGRASSSFSVSPCVCVCDTGKPFFVWVLSYATRQFNFCLGDRDNSVFIGSYFPIDFFFFFLLLKKFLNFSHLLFLFLFKYFFIFSHLWQFDLLKSL